MPIQYSKDNGVIYTSIIGRITDEELLSYYMQPVFLDCQPPWYEIVDGRLITDMAVTTMGQSKLSSLAASRSNQLRGGRVAMVATSPVTYGMFRIWEVLRGDIDYELQVFRDYETALHWIVSRQTKA